MVNCVYSEVCVVVNVERSVKMEEYRYKASLLDSRKFEPQRKPRDCANEK